MFRLIIIFILELSIISVVQSQIYFKCKFDEGASPCRLIPGGTAPELKVETFILLSDSSEDPLLPLSDVTSITTATVGNGLQCKLPYQLNGNSKDIYFCSKFEGSTDLSSCITTDTTKQECVLGRYVQLQLKPAEKHTYYIEVTGTADLSCLSFYYYITRPNAGEIIIWCTDIVGTHIQQIGKVSNVSYNGWHRAEFTFSPHVNNYHIFFDLQRSEHSGDVFFIALDEIMIINDRCESALIKTTTNTQQTSTTTSLSTTPTTQESTQSSVEFSSTSISSTTTSVPLSSSIEYDSTISTAIIPPESTTPSLSTTTMGDKATPPSSTPKSNLGLTLSLSFGLGFSAIILIIGFLMYNFKIKGRLQKRSVDKYDNYIPMESPFDKSNSNEGFDTDRY